MAISSENYENKEITNTKYIQKFGRVLRNLSPPKQKSVAQCSNCGAMDLIPSGACYVCINCGETTGCS